MNLRLEKPAVLALLVAACVASPARAVNLVPNPSFESVTSCPTGYGQLSLAAPWDVPNTGTSDCLNACAPAVFPSVNVPYTELGFQNARTGVGIAGLIPYSSAADYREYLEAPLTSPLTPGTPYLVKFYVSLADTALFAIDRLGAYLSVGPVGPVPNYAPLPFTPQVQSPQNVALNDATNWTLVSGVYVAVGGEDHITIGNFHDDASTTTFPGPNTWPGGSYYFVDDVSVEVNTPTIQACCMPDGTCSMQFPGECTLVGGSPGGNGSSCSPNPCGVTATRPRTWGALKTIYR